MNLRREWLAKFREETGLKNYPKGGGNRILITSALEGVGLDDVYFEVRRENPNRYNELYDRRLDSRHGSYIGLTPGGYVAMKRRERMSKLHAVPCTLVEANKFVSDHHRHHGSAVGHKFSLAVADETGVVRGVAIVGRPVARGLDTGYVLEVNRLATDGCENACSFLYSLAARVAKSMGYHKIVTYILDTEPGISLRAAGWTKVATTAGGSWNCAVRPRVDKHPTQKKTRWEKVLNA